jgi:hypothetical protein
VVVPYGRSAASVICERAEYLGEHVSVEARVGGLGEPQKIFFAGALAPRRAILRGGRPAFGHAQLRESGFPRRTKVEW